MNQAALGLDRQLQRAWRQAKQVTSATLGDGALADEAADQAVFDLELRMCREVPPPRSPDAWIARVARRRAVDLLRRSATKRTVAAGDLNERPDRGRTPAASVVIEWRRALLDAMLQRGLLTAQQRLVVEVTLVARSHREAARRLGTSKRDLRRSLARIAAKLRRSVAPLPRHEDVGLCDGRARGPRLSMLYGGR